MYSINQIQELQKNTEYFKKEGDKYCLVSLVGKSISSKDVTNQANFCVLQIIDAYKKNYLSSKEANDLINKIDAFDYSKDLLGYDRTIEKINEIIKNELHIPYFNSLCVLCEEVFYDSN